MDEPTITDIDAFFLNAFWDLSTCRSHGMSIGPIPWDRIVHYASRRELDEEITDPFIRCIRAMDGVYLDWQHKESERQSKRPGRRSR